MVTLIPAIINYTTSLPFQGVNAHRVFISPTHKPNGYATYQQESDPNLNSNNQHDQTYGYQTLVNHITTPPTQFPLTDSTNGYNWHQSNSNSQNSNSTTSNHYNQQHRGNEYDNRQTIPHDQFGPRTTYTNNFESHKQFPNVYSYQPAPNYINNHSNVFGVPPNGNGSPPLSSLTHYANNVNQSMSTEQQQPHGYYETPTTNEHHKLLEERDHSMSFNSPETPVTFYMSDDAPAPEANEQPPHQQPEYYFTDVVLRNKNFPHYGDRGSHISQYDYMDKSNNPPYRFNNRFYHHSVRFTQPGDFSNPSRSISDDHNFGRYSAFEGDAEADPNYELTRDNREDRFQSESSEQSWQSDMPQYQPHWRDDPYY